LGPMSITEKEPAGSPAVTVLDKPLPKCERRKPKPLEPEYHYHRLRKAIHIVCVVIFFILPLSSLMRFDIPRQRFYFFGYELWISEFAIIFFSLMFLMFVIAAMAMLWGRVYCGYLCPQMIFSEASIQLQSKLQRTVNKHLRWQAKWRNLLSNSLFYLIAGIASVVLAFVFICYFVEPRDLLHRLLSFDVQTTGGFAGAVTTILILLDFLFLRQRFCTTVCPYGYLQGMLGDGHTLIVHYRDENRECIECKKCVRVCHMGIDIRTSPYQIECIHCGECIDACSDVLARLGKQGLIHYVWGEHGEKLGTGTKTWSQRLGLRDAKRAVVLLILFFYAAGLFTALSMRRAVLVQISPIRASLYRQDQDGTVYNRFRLKAANRSHQQQAIVLAIEGLPGTRFSGFENAVVIDSGQALEREFEIAARPSAALSPGVNHFRLVSRVGNERESIEQTFITPFQDSR
jgi:cytochrome c oxidase accessory protein FixG